MDHNKNTDKLDSVLGSSKEKSSQVFTKVEKNTVLRLPRPQALLFSWSVVPVLLCDFTIKHCAARGRVPRLEFSVLQRRKRNGAPAQGDEAGTEKNKDCSLLVCFFYIFTFSFRT